MSDRAHGADGAAAPAPSLNASAVSTDEAAAARTTATVSKKKEEMRNESTGISVGDSSHTLADVQRIIGNGSFGVVFQASVEETGEIVAIKKVLQDKRFKNRELQIMRQLSHVNIVPLKHCFYCNGEKPDELYLNLVLEYIPDTVYGVARQLQKSKQYMPIVLRNEPNVSYICSRYYRAPELIFGATDYTTAIGASFREEIEAMNPNYTEFQFPQIKAHSWNKIFRSRTPPEAIDLLEKMLVYDPKKRVKPLEAAAHPFFDELRQEGLALPGDTPVPPLFNFTLQELAQVDIGTREILVPAHERNAANWPVLPDGSWPDAAAGSARASS
ncbi:hypothetical protein PybrP1_011337 [[Pythium] brassicae (nom. inval.)]|nr:hypothetical protein PybrP1_011337 [[Pythium] brassicae (nom. inval.)]